MARNRVTTIAVVDPDQSGITPGSMHPSMVSLQIPGGLEGSTIDFATRDEGAPRGWAAMWGSKSSVETND